MTNEEATRILKIAIEDSKEHIRFCFDKKGIEALDLAIKALEKISHLIDRPCEACDLRKEKGCCKWNCIFEEVEE